MDNLKLSEKGWLVAANALLLAALMVWLQGWWQALRYYSQVGQPTLTSEIALVLVSLMIITCLASIYYIWRSEKKELSYGMLFFVLFCILVGIILNLGSILYKGFIGAPADSVLGSLKPDCTVRYIIFGILSLISLIYLYLLLWKPQFLSWLGNTIPRLLRMK